MIDTKGIKISLFKEVRRTSNTKNQLNKYNNLNSGGHSSVALLKKLVFIDV
jgi:hypothetical protein